MSSVIVGFLIVTLQWNVSGLHDAYAMKTNRSMKTRLKFTMFTLYCCYPVLVHAFIVTRGLVVQILLWNFSFTSLFWNTKEMVSYNSNWVGLPLLIRHYQNQVHDWSLKINLKMCVVTHESQSFEHESLKCAFTYTFYWKWLPRLMWTWHQIYRFFFVVALAKVVAPSTYNNNKKISVFFHLSKSDLCPVVCVRWISVSSGCSAALVKMFYTF